MTNVSIVYILVEYYIHERAVMVHVTDKMIEPTVVTVAIPDHDECVCCLYTCGLKAHLSYAPDEL